MGTLASRKKTSLVLTKYEKNFENPISLLSAARKGLRADAVFDFIFLSQFPAILVEQLLNKTIKTFNNYREENTMLDATTSEKLLKCFSLYSKGASIFGSSEEFNKWMTEPAFGLGNQLPQDLLFTITGIDLVSEELSRIEYGDLA